MKTTIELDPKIYDLETVFHTLYNLMDEAYFLVEMNGRGAYSISVEPKAGKEADKVCSLLKEELLNVKNFNLNRERNSAAEQLIYRRCLAELKKND